MTALRVLTFNLRVDGEETAGPPWTIRREAVARILRDHEPHVVGVQEALPHMLTDLTQVLPDMEWFGVARDAAMDEHCAILWRPDRVSVMAHDTFWLSKTPMTPGSRSWDSTYPRIATWGKLSVSDWSTPIFVFNTHFDHESRRARHESARVLQQQIEQIAGSAATVVVGDLNASPDSSPYHILTDPTGGRPLRDTLRESTAPHHGPIGTFHGFEGRTGDAARIDYIFVRGPLRVQRHGTLTDRGREHLPSDHFPVLADIIPDTTAP